MENYQKESFVLVYLYCCLYHSLINHITNKPNIDFRNFRIELIIGSRLDALNKYHLI